MAAIVSTRILRLQATSPRVVPLPIDPSLIPGLPETIAAVKGIKISAPSNVFQVNNAGAATPTSIALTAKLTNITGTVTWTAVNGSASSLPATGSTFTLAASAMTSNSLTIRASVVVDGSTYKDEWTIAKTADGAKGDDGAPGGKYTEVTAYRWLLGAPGSVAGAATYTWATQTPSAYPSGWSASPPTSPGSGYTLYTLTVRLQAAGTDATTAFNWSAGSFGSIGYRQDGSIGPQGPGARIAYMVTTSSTPPALGATQPVTGDTLPNGSARPGSTALNTWSATPKATLAEGEFMYQSDGVYDPSANTTTWQAAYLSNLKVGSLSAISAVLGVVQISANGALYSGKTTASSTAAGFHLGYSGTTYTFFIGNAGDTKSLKWDGSDLTVKGGTITGSMFRTATAGSRIEIDGPNNTFNLYYGSALALLIDPENSAGLVVINNTSLNRNGIKISSNQVSACLEATNSSTTASAAIAVSATATYGTALSGIVTSGGDASSAAVDGFAIGGTAIALRGNNNNGANTVALQLVPTSNLPTRLLGGALHFRNTAAFGGSQQPYYCDAGAWRHIPIQGSTYSVEINGTPATIKF